MNYDKTMRCCLSKVPVVGEGLAAEGTSLSCRRAVEGHGLSHRGSSAASAGDYGDVGTVTEHDGLWLELGSVIGHLDNALVAGDTSGKNGLEPQLFGAVIRGRDLELRGGLAGDLQGVLVKAALGHGGVHVVVRAELQLNVSTVASGDVHVDFDGLSFAVGPGDDACGPHPPGLVRVRRGAVDAVTARGALTTSVLVADEVVVVAVLREGGEAHPPHDVPRWGILQGHVAARLSNERHG